MPLVTIKVSHDAHAQAKVLSAALELPMGEIVRRALALYRVRYSSRVDAVTRPSEFDLQMIPIQERIALLTDTIKERTWGCRVQVIDSESIPYFIVDPLRDMDLFFELEQLLGEPVMLLSTEQAQERGLDLSRARPL